MTNASMPILMCRKAGNGACSVSKMRTSQEAHSSLAIRQSVYYIMYTVMYYIYGNQYVTYYIVRIRMMLL